MIRLYHFRFSTNVERVTLALAYKGVEVESIWVDPDDRGPVDRVSGQRLVPVIEDGERVVSDSAAILRYLEERYPELPLYPGDEAKERNQLSGWGHSQSGRNGDGVDVGLVGVSLREEADQEGDQLALVLDHEASGCQRVAVVGDNLASDIAGAKRAGPDAILVLTGASTEADLYGAEHRPDLVVPSLAELG
jgi:glutathione S-transferase